MAAICSWHLIPLPEPESTRVHGENKPQPALLPATAGQKQPAALRARASRLGAGRGGLAGSWGTAGQREAAARSAPAKLPKPFGVFKGLRNSSPCGWLRSRGHVPLSLVGWLVVARLGEAGGGMGCSCGIPMWGLPSPPHFCHPKMHQQRRFSEPQQWKRRCREREPRAGAHPPEDTRMDAPGAAATGGMRRQSPR